jgi:DTW domain-containing protein YfiP
VEIKLTNISFCVDCTLPLQSCLCRFAPSLTLPSKTHILFHPRELERRNSSGRLLKHCFNIPSTRWHRLKNNQLESIFDGYALLYPADINSKQTSLQIDQHPAVPAKGFLWIDATWQESRKMLNQSPWLNKLPKYAVSAHLTNRLPASQYTLRRNQTPQGLSTIETFSYWLYEQNQPKSGQDLLNFFNQFQTAFLAARNSGLFK